MRCCNSSSLMKLDMIILWVLRCNSGKFRIDKHCLLIIICRMLLLLCLLLLGLWLRLRLLLLLRLSLENSWLPSACQLASEEIQVLFRFTGSITTYYSKILTCFPGKHYTPLFTISNSYAWASTNRLIIFGDLSRHRVITKTVLLIPMWSIITSSHMISFNIRIGFFPLKNKLSRFCMTHRNYVVGKCNRCSGRFWSFWVSIWLSFLWIICWCEVLSKCVLFQCRAWKG